MASEPQAGNLLLLPVGLSACWTLAYQLVLVARWPAATIVWIFFVFVGLGFLAGARWWTSLFRYRFHLSHVLLFFLAMACSSVTLFIRRPNQDDVVYFHRALTQLSALSQPILTRQTSVDMDAAAFSPVHLATSHEMLMAFIGHYFGIDPLYCYQVVGHAVAAFFIPLVLYWCVRRLGLERWHATVGAFLGVGFLLLDSSGLASFGNTAFTRLWQGKSIVWILLLPVALSLTYRFLGQRSRRDLIWLILLAIAGVGLSSSALYLIPAVIGSCGLSFLCTDFCSNGRITLRESFRRCCLCAIPLIYPVGILVLLRVNIIPKPVDVSGFGPTYIPWRQGIDYVVGQPADHFRNLILLIGVPLLAVRGRIGLFLFFYICAIWLLCLNPLLSHWWMRNIFASCYFRLVYLLPLPLFCGMLPAAMRRLHEIRSDRMEVRILTALATLGLVVSFGFSFRGFAITPRSAERGWKSPCDYQLVKSNTDFATAAGKYIARSKLLAPAWTASCELPLLFPQMKVVAPRLVIHYFANAGNAKEGALRRNEQAFIEGEKATNPRRIQAQAASFRAVIMTGRANAVAVKDSESDRVLAALQAIDPRWHRVLQVGGLVLMLPDSSHPTEAANATGV